MKRPAKPSTSHSQPANRSGKVLALFAVALPTLLAIVGLVLDGGRLMNTSRIAQHAADAAATAAASRLRDGGSADVARDTAERFVRNENGRDTAAVVVSVPPESGPLAGDASSAEVIVTIPTSTHFLSFVGGSPPFVSARAVARYEPATTDAALVVLDPDPPQLAIPAIGGLLPPLPALVGGLELIGTSRVRVDGAIHVNTTWGGFDEDGNMAGSSAPPPTAIAAPSLFISEKLQARDIRVVGGVDDPDNYGHFVSGEPTPLRAGRLPVPDPLISLPAPTTAADPVNVSGVLRGGMRIADNPLLSPPRTLQPGVYDYLHILSGRITFSPGVYIIRGVDPLTGIALNITGGRITASGVMFYITSSPGYSPASGLPDDSDGETVPPAPGLGAVLPSTVINVLLPGSVYRGLDDPGSPFDGMLIYQRRADRRPVLIVNDLLLGGNDIEGVIYAKWGHVILSGSGFGEMTAVAGTLRLINVTPSLIAPTDQQPPAYDVFLVE